MKKRTLLIMVLVLVLVTIMTAVLVGCKDNKKDATKEPKKELTFLKDVDKTDGKAVVNAIKVELDKNNYTTVEDFMVDGDKGIIRTELSKNIIRVYQITHGYGDGDFYLARTNTGYDTYNKDLEVENPVWVKESSEESFDTIYEQYLSYGAGFDLADMGILDANITYNEKENNYKLLLKESDINFVTMSIIEDTIKFDYKYVDSERDSTYTISKIGSTKPVIPTVE